MIVPPSVEVLVLDPTAELTQGAPCRLVLPPTLRELHLNLDPWVIGEARSLESLRVRV